VLQLPPPLLLLACLQVNSSPYEDGWMIKVKLSNAGELGDLLDSSAYEAHCQH
jgi:glycine cleavage system H protein